MKLIVAVLLAASLVNIAASWDFISKNCCEPHDDEHLGRICDDGSRAPLIGCCGIGSCNVMCCNCDGGCISGKHKPYKLLGIWGAEITPNFGLVGSSAPKAGADFVKEAAKTAAGEAGKAAWNIGRQATKKQTDDQPNISYHVWKP